jgi:hypothetical protein
VIDDEIGIGVGERAGRLGDDGGKLGYGLAPLARDTGPRDMNAEPGRGEMGELRLTQPVDRRNDQADSGCRNVDAVRSGGIDRDRIHVGSLLRSRTNLAFACARHKRLSALLRRKHRIPPVPRRPRLIPAPAARDREIRAAGRMCLEHNRLNLHDL